MKRIPALATVLLTLLSIMAPEARAQGFEALAKDVAQELAARQYDKVEARFDVTMSAAMPLKKLQDFWDTLLGQFGAFRSITAATATEQGDYHIVVLTCAFERASLNLRLAFDKERRIAGLFIAPAAPADVWKTPDYAKPNAFHDESVTVTTGPWQLPGTLTIPNGAGPFPALVLVQGSGPHDEDETIGPNKPFKDLAWGLASQGIAVLRYDKRTHKYAAELQKKLANLTVKDEVTDDALSAVALLSTRPEIDKRRIYVLGHSLGGMLAPRIAQGNTQVAGIIMLAGTTRPLEQVIVEQLKYIAGLDGKVTPESQKRIDAAEQAAKEIESPALKADTIVDLLGSKIPASYFLDLRNYDPASVAAQLNIPMLILRGERDYQVTKEDFDGWKKALAGSPKVTFKLYPGLFHLFMPSSTPGTGLGSPADYEKPGHVSADVINDIAAWIKAQQGESK